MQYKKYTKQRIGSIQGLRSLKDTLPKNIKKVISNRGHIYSETLSNWKLIAGKSLFKVCYPKSFRNSNKFGVSTLLIAVKRGHEVNLEYSKRELMNKMNNLFGKTVVEKIKFISFEEEQNDLRDTESFEKDVTNNKYQKKIENVKNEKIKKSLQELTKVFKEK